MKKFILFNLANRSVLAALLKNGRPSFSFDVTEALQMDTREQAETMAGLIIPLLTRKTEGNNFWCDGFALTVLEVFV